MSRRLLLIPTGVGSGGGGDLTNYYTKAEVNALIADFVTASTNDLINYYLKSETYTQAEVNTLIGSIESIHFEFAASTSDVQDPQSNVIYLIGPSGTGADQYEEYVYANNQWKKIGDTSIDLSGYATLTDLQNAINTAMATLQQYAVDNFYQKYEVDAMIAQVQTLQGIQGIKGVDGVNGEQGIQGIKGTDGVNGVNGQQGIQGIRGDDGKNGNDGLQGIQGASGGGVETVELTELTESELGELYEIVTTAIPVGIDDYLAEHRLVAYGMPVISWGDGAFTISEYEELIADEEGEIGVAFYSDTNIIKGAELPDTITTYWYCIFKRREGGNDTYELVTGTNTYENNGIQGIQGTAGTNGVDGLQGLQGTMGIQGPAGAGASKIELTTLPVQDLVQFYQAVLAGTMRDFSQYTGNGYPIINAYKMNAGWVVDTSYLTGTEGTTYTTDGTEVAIVMNQRVEAVGTRGNETQRYIYTFITLFSPTIVQTYGATIDMDIKIGYDQVAQLQFVLADDSIVNYTMPLTQW